jgi:hypothetical protein
MVEDAGTIQAEIRLKIDDFKKGAMEAQKAIKDLEAELKQSKAEISEAFKKGTRAVFEYNVELRNIKLAEEAGAKTAQEAAQAKLAANQKYLDMLIDVRNRIAEVSGEEDKQVAVYDKLIKEQVKLRDSARETADSMQEAAEAGTVYVKGFGKGQVELNKKLNDFVSTMQGISPKMGELGGKIASLFSKPIVAMVPVISQAFQAMLPVIGTIIVAVTAIAAAVKKGISAYQEQTKQINASAEASTRLQGTYAETTKTLEEQVKVWDRIRASIGTLGTILGDMGAFFKGELGTLGEIYDKQLKQTTEARILKDEYAAINEAEAKYKQTLDEIQTAETAHIKDTEEANRDRLSALERQADELIRIRELAHDKAGNAQAIKDIDERLARLKIEKDRLEKLTIETKAQTAELTAQDKITQARTAAIEKYDQAVRRANDALAAGLIDQEEHEERLAAARAQEYSDLEDIVAQYKLTTGETVRIRNETGAIVKNTQDAVTAAKELKALEELRRSILTSQSDTLAEQEIAREREAGNLERAIELESELIDVQREREREVLTASDEFKKLKAEEQAEILAGYDAITEGIKQSYANETKAANLRIQAQETYKKTLAQIQAQRDAYFIKEDEAQKKRLQAEQQYIQTLSGLRDEYRQLNDLNEEQEEQIREEIANHVAVAESIETSIEASDRLAQAQQAVDEYVRQIDSDYKDIITDLEEQKILENDLLDVYEKQLAIINIRRQAALDEMNARYKTLEAERGAEGLTPQEIANRDNLTDAINRNYDAIEDGVNRTKNKLNIFERIFSSKEFQAGLQIGEAAITAFGNIASTITQITQQQAADAMAEIDRMLEEELEKIEDFREAALLAGGFIEATTSENIQAQIDAAKEANDEILQYQLERRQEEMRINEQYDAEAKAEKDKAEREKAEIEYKAAQTSHALSITQAIVNGALAISRAAVNAWPLPAIPMIAAAGIATGTQLAVIMANPPKPPKFADGGIVPGQPHGRTDTVAAMLTPGELILNRAQQETVATQMGGSLTVQMLLDGRLIGETVIGDYVNKGLILIEAKRGIR